MVAIDEKSMPSSEANRRRTQPISDCLYQGMSLDPVTGLYYERNRNYSPSPGVWTSGEPFRVIGASRWAAGNADARRQTEAVSEERHTEGCQRSRCDAWGPPSGGLPFTSPRRRGFSAYRLAEISPRSAFLGGSQNSSRREIPTTRTGSLHPLQYINGANTYQFMGSDPVGMVDAEGLHSFFYQILHPPAYAIRQQLMKVAVQTEEGGRQLGNGTTLEGCQCWYITSWARAGQS